MKNYVILFLQVICFVLLAIVSQDKCEAAEVDSEMKFLQEACADELTEQIGLTDQQFIQVPDEYFSIYVEHSLERIGGVVRKVAFVHITLFNAKYPCFATMSRDKETFYTAPTMVHLRVFIQTGKQLSGLTGDHRGA